LILKGKLTMLVSFNTAATILLSVSLVLVVGRLLPRQKEGRKFRPDFRLFKTMLAYGMKFYISIMAGFVIFRVRLLIVNHLRGAGEAGIYAVASQVSFLLLMMPGVVLALLFAQVSLRHDAT